MIDWNRVADLRGEIGDESFGEVVALFLEETDEVIAGLDGPMAAPDLARALHFLKGSSLNLGFEDMAQLCQKGEAAAGQGMAVDVAPILRCYQDSKAAFQAQLDQFRAA